MEQKGDLVPASRVRVAAVLAVALIALGLALLPVLVSVGAGGVVRFVATAFGSLVAVVGGLKLVAVAWGLVPRHEAEFQGQRVSAVVD